MGLAAIVFLVSDFNILHIRSESIIVAHSLTSRTYSVSSTDGGVGGCGGGCGGGRGSGGGGGRGSGGVG